jgi:hypothetical protein
MKSRRVMTALLVLAVSGCAGNRLEPLAPFARTGGVTIAPVKIDSSPTTAWIYIDGKYVGNTPLVYGLAYDSNTHYIEVIAEPLPDHPVQQRQTKHIRVPPLPIRVHFFLNNREDPENEG